MITTRNADASAGLRPFRFRLVVAALASLLLLGVLFAVPRPAVAQSTGQDDAPAFVVALGSSLSDVGTAASLVAAGVGDAVLFAEAVNRLGNANSSLLSRQVPEQIYIVGGAGAIGADVEAQVRSLAPGVSIKRFAGSTRVETAALAADEALAGRSASKIIIANGWSLPDVGAAAAAVAAGAADVVLYAERDDLGELAQSALETHRPGTVLIVGGRAALSAQVELAAATAAGGSRTTRLGGATRVDTAARIAREALPGGADTVIVADGWSPADVGVAATIAASLADSAVLYTADSDGLRAAFDSAVRSLAPDRIVLVDLSSNASQKILNGLSAHGSFTRITQPIDATRSALGEDVGEVHERSETQPADAIADAEAYMVELVNELRSSVGVPPLHQNDLIGEVARRWSRSLADRRVLDLQLSDHNPHYVSEYPPGSVLAGENLALVPCLADCLRHLRTEVLRAFDGLSNSPGHYENMVREGFGQIGVGIVVSAELRHMWVTQNFACYAPAPVQGTCPTGSGPVRSGSGVSGEDLSVVSGIEVPYSVSSLRDGAYLVVDFNKDYTGGRGDFCAIRSDKTLMCWSGSSASWLRDAPSGEFKDLAVGDDGACAVRVSGAIECWGRSAPSEFLEPPNGTFDEVTAGPLHACALRSDRTIACWGAEISGGDASGPYVDDSHLHPPGGTYSSVSAGLQHACALSTDRTVRCWGRNGAGQTDAPRGQFATVVSGTYGSCGLRVDGAVLCWGDDFDGPVRFGGIEASGRSVESIALGSDMLCALDTDSDLACKIIKGASVVGTNIDPDDGTPLDVSVPGGPFSSISVGHKAGCGLRPDGSIACWGRGGSSFDVPPFLVPPGSYTVLSNSCGLRGDGTMVCWKPLRAPDLPRTFLGRPLRLGIAVFPGEYVAISSGAPSGFEGEFAVCGVTTDAAINCFGPDLATDWVSRQPQRIEGSFRSVTVGAGAACALRTNATIHCWGQDQFGLLDAPSGSFTHISAGDRHFCAVRSNQSLKCWGNNGAGQLDAPSGSFVSVSSSDDRSCAVRSNGTAACWGTDWWSPASSETFDSISLGQYGGHCVEQSGDFTCTGPDGVHLRLPVLPRDDQGARTDWAYLDYNSRCGIRSDGGITCWPELPGGVSWHTSEDALWVYGEDVDDPPPW